MFTISYRLLSVMAHFWAVLATASDDRQETWLAGADGPTCASSCPYLKGESAPQLNGGLKEYSVVYTERALNHMSTPFKRVMRSLHDTLIEAYSAERAVLVPGGGTFAMEAVARQLATGKEVLVVRNGYFSYRWSHIFTEGGIPEGAVVVKASGDGAALPQFAPPPLVDLEAEIASRKPAVVFAPHVETSVGMILPDEYIAGLGAAAHRHGALFVLDGVASGTIWVNMKDLGVDVYITAPQKGWSGHACAGVVMLSRAGIAAVRATQSSSMALNLKSWLQVMDAYLASTGPGHKYYATMPTDCLRVFAHAAAQVKAYGWAAGRADLETLGRAVRRMLWDRFRLRGLAAPGYEAPGVVVVHVADKGLPGRMALAGVQVAAGVPLQLGETPLTTVRFGLFGLDKVRFAKR